jgi:Cell division control protein 14, SIN component
MIHPHNSQRADLAQIFLDLLDPSNCPAIQSSTLLALVTSFLDHPSNVRTFEACDGLLVITSLFKTRATSKEVKMRLVEVLYFYLMPETSPSRTASSATNTAVLGGRGKELVAAFDRRRETVSVGGETTGKGMKTKTTEEKQYLLGKYLSNVNDFVEDLKEGPGLFQVGGM